MQKNTPHWPANKLDQPFFASMLGAAWLAILSGFVYHNVRKYQAGQLTYPWIVHIHSVFFVGWLLLFTAQMVLVRRRQVPRTGNSAYSERSSPPRWWFSES